MNYLGTKKLITERLILRKFEENDFLDMFNNYASSEEITRFLTREAYKNPEDCKKFIQNNILKNYKENNGKTFKWAICLKEDNKIIGSIDVVHLFEDYDVAEIGYVLSKKHWNKGIMSEAFKSVICYLFNEVNLHAITAKHNELNPASGKVMEHNGLIHYDDKVEIIKGREVVSKNYKIINKNYKKK